MGARRNEPTMRGLLGLFMLDVKSNASKDTNRRQPPSLEECKGLAFVLARGLYELV